MSHSPAISVIIPVYNVESWLRRAVGSLQNQTCTSYEILLVDDGSTDGSGALCDKLADDDVRIRVIHQENQGAAAARNAAIEIARGDYLYFMDGDDWCDRTMLKDMYRVASEHNLDLLITGFTIDTYYDDEGKYYRELRNAPDRIFESQKNSAQTPASFSMPNFCMRRGTSCIVAATSRKRASDSLARSGTTCRSTSMSCETSNAWGASTVTTTTSCVLAPKAKTPSTVLTCTTNVKKNIAG